MKIRNLNHYNVLRSFKSKIKCYTVTIVIGGPHSSQRYVPHPFTQAEFNVMKTGSDNMSYQPTFWSDIIGH